jgi:NADPH:quinone reductase-like Zn-dependent oxidoreductase
VKAVVCPAYDVLEVQEIEKPEPADDGVLVRVRASSVNPADRVATTTSAWVLRPLMGLRKPRSTRVGTDFAGTVEAAGKDVTAFRIGDEVFGGKSGAYAEYVCVSQDRAIAKKPANVTFEQAGAVGIAGLTALQGLRDKAGVRPGQTVLVNGASGGVGTFAIQIAKALGAEVTAVCSTRNVETARALGADRVVDYTEEDFTRSGEHYDVLFDIAGSRSWSECRRVLAPNGTLVIAGAPKGGRILGPFGHIVAMRIASLLRGSQKAVFYITKFNKADIEALAELLGSGTVAPVIDRRYAMSEVADAFAYHAEGHAHGKIVVAVE